MEGNKDEHTLGKLTMMISLQEKANSEKWG